MFSVLKPRGRIMLIIVDNFIPYKNIVPIGTKLFQNGDLLGTAKGNKLIGK